VRDWANERFSRARMLRNVRFNRARLLGIGQTGDHKACHAPWRDFCLLELFAKWSAASIEILVGSEFRKSVTELVGVVGSDSNAGR
jgi:hypothetical protein